VKIEKVCFNKSFAQVVEKSITRYVEIQLKLTFYFMFTKATEIIKGKYDKIFDFNYVVKMLSRTSLLMIFLRFKRF